MNSDIEFVIYQDNSTTFPISKVINLDKELTETQLARIARRVLQNMTRRFLAASLKHLYNLKKPFLINATYKGNKYFFIAVPASKKELLNRKPFLFRLTIEKTRLILKQKSQPFESLNEIKSENNNNQQDHPRTTSDLSNSKIFEKYFSPIIYTGMKD